MCTPDMYERRLSVTPTVTIGKKLYPSILTYFGVFHLNLLLQYSWTPTYQRNSMIFNNKRYFSFRLIASITFGNYIVKSTS